MMWTARDRVRPGRHETFEVVHRYGGWAALGILTVLVATSDAGGAAIELLVAVIALVAHPWLSVRRVACEVLGVTDQAVIIALPGRAARGEFVRVSREGIEWHAFAVAMSGGERAGRFCLVIRRAAMGDDLVTRVLAGGNVTLIDSARGRPDVGAHVAARAAEFEAVFVVSNETVRDDVARVCRRLDIPCYGPTFDS
jgi:hypothetical protein